MKLSSIDMHLSDDKVTGFVKIVEKGRAQQTTIAIRKLEELSKILGALKNLGIQKIIVTVEKDCPIVFGSKTVGLAISSLVRRS